MGKFAIVNSIGAMALTGLVVAGGIAATPARADPWTQDMNHPEYWVDYLTGEGYNEPKCVKDGFDAANHWDSDGDYTLVVVKYATSVDLHRDVKAGDGLTTVTGQKISHLIKCNASKGGNTWTGTTSTSSETSTTTSTTVTTSLDTTTDVTSTTGTSTTGTTSTTTSEDSSTVLPTGTSSGTTNGTVTSSQTSRTMSETSSTSQPSSTATSSVTLTVQPTSVSAPVSRPLSSTGTVTTMTTTTATGTMTGDATSTLATPASPTLTATQTVSPTEVSRYGTRQSLATTGSNVDRGITVAIALIIVGLFGVMVASKIREK